MALTSAGRFVRLDLTRGTAEPLTYMPASEVSLTEPMRLHVSDRGEVAAVVNSRGQAGVLVDLRLGQPRCWVGDRTLAIYGYGLDDHWFIPAAWLFDVESGEEVGWFAGPTGDFVFDGYLFSMSEKDGMAVWDVATGERLLHDPEPRPTRYHRGAKQFLTLLPDGTFQVTRLRDPGAGLRGQSS